MPVQPNQPSLLSNTVTNGIDAERILKNARKSADDRGQKQVSAELSE